MGWKKNRREGRSERRSGSHAESGFVGSFRGSTWREQRHKRREDNGREQEEERSGFVKGRTELTERYQVLQGMGNMMKEIRSWSGYAN